MTIRYAALDLDGTLIDEADQPYDGIVGGLGALRARGVLPIVVTGRAARSVRNLVHLDELFGQVDDAVLVSEGNSRLDRRANRLDCLRTCPPEALARLLADPAADLVAESSGEFHATTARAAAQFAMAYRLPRRQIGINARALSTRARLTAITVFRGEIPADLGCAVEPIGPFGARVVRPSGTGKAAALARHLRERFGEPDLSRTLAVGDGASDVPMLSACAVSAAPERADRVAAAAATHHLRGDLAAFLNDFRPEGS
ncbi:HAD family hydrolase [Kutzneria sp. NPDC052558]|uniref:HAD family hydrolase n=1 Tax=Kutzneria sp. NPDC052558 TaxID=3364121 RepID=UPI0037C6688E